jgi:hypothetical protein
MLAQLIAQYAAAEATAGNWSAVAAKLNALTIERTSAGTLTSMARTLAALAPSEREPTLQAFAATKLGESGLQKLAANGLDFAHPLTTGLIESLRASLSAEVADKLLRLGRWMVSPAADAGLGTVTAEQCRIAWSTDRLQSQWASLQNDGGINTAVAAGDRTALKAALIAAAGVL